MKDAGTFRPPRHLRNSYIQSILGSSKIRSLGRNPMVETEQEMILDAGEGVRLQGFYSPQTDGESKGLVIMLSGWEGSSRSTYMLCTGRYFYRNGYSIFRLNFRDHGETHHLNEGLFYGTLLDEVFESVRQAAGLESGLPTFLVGFSMGGNFALRVARKCSTDRIENLMHVAAISPGLNPTTATDAIDTDWIFKMYFLRKWRRSLRKKEVMFPHTYNFSELWALRTCKEMTDWMVENYSDFKNTNEYFQGYTLTDGALKDIAVPTTMITSEDDPLVGIEDFNRLKLNDLTELIIHCYGGHNGFILRFPFSSWYEQKLVEIFDRKSRSV